MLFQLHRLYDCNIELDRTMIMSGEEHKNFGGGGRGLVANIIEHSPEQ
jgi:hypothetical protein